MTYLQFAILVLVALLAALAQLCLKLGAAGGGIKSAGLRFKLLVTIGLALFGGCAITQSFMMRQIPLTLVTPVSALIYVFVPLLSRVFLKETMRPRFWAGVLCLIAGVSIISGGALTHAA